MAENNVRRIVVFDLGGVLIDWNPRYLYRKLIDDEAEMERFLAEVVNHDWNLQQDAGRGFAEAVGELQARHPEQAELIAAYFERWPEMMGDAIEGTLAILEELRAREVPLYALTNWSAETFPHASARFDFLDWFLDILVSGEVGLIKPDPRFYQLICTNNGFAPADAVFIDDQAANAQGATDMGIHGIHFTGPEALRGELAGLGFL